MNPSHVVFAALVPASLLTIASAAAQPIVDEVQAPAVLTPRSSHLLVGLVGAAVQRTDATEWRLTLTVEVPLERVPSVVAPSIAERPSALPARVLSTGDRRFPVTPRLARECVQAAWRAQAANRSLQGLVTRARLSAILPETSVRMGRGSDSVLRLTPTDSDPYRTQQADEARQYLEARLAWRLDRLVFAGEEIAIERLRAQNAEARTKIAGAVLELLFAWQRAVLTQRDPSLSPADKLEASVRQAEAELMLDVATGGWFSAYLANARRAAASGR